MFHWQSASRLLIATFALVAAVAVGAPALAQGDVAVGDDGTTASAATTAASGEAGASESDADAASNTPKNEKTKKKRRNPTDWGDLRNYIPSIGLGFGVTFDKAESTVSGSTRWNDDDNTNVCRYYNPNKIPATTCMQYADAFDSSFVGGAFNVDARIDLPEFDAPGRPRLFAATSLVIQNQDEKALASYGVPRSQWNESNGVLGQTNQDGYARIEQTVAPANLIFAGVGASFELPIESYPVRINTSVNYFRAKNVVGALHDWAAPTGTPSVTLNPTHDLITQGIAPGIGLDVDIGQVDWMAIGFYSTTYVGIPLSGDTWSATVENGYAPVAPGENVTTYTHDRGIDVSVFVGLRFSLVRD